MGNIIRTFDVQAMMDENNPWTRTLAATMFAAVRATCHTALQALPMQLASG
jgi:hypothetical protein